MIPLYLVKWIILYNFNGLYLTIPVSKFITNVILVLPCTIILAYYAYHICKIIPVERFRRFCKWIVSFSVFRTIIYILAFVFSKSKKDVVKRMADICDSEPDPNNCGFCYAVIVK